ncbi:hypothetical protein RHGRI_016639 [Rhododendron griersonianum]|uniref:Protein FAR1-RELATED SEQUENCE n=1 Tax=Rhododendron griersonianum TaxID=479676 RepID=A0AAV6JUT9_9ERIC|nr:hypothetical protein RHGRI_016639 [Rhododendron griersonianum]
MELVSLDDVEVDNIETPENVVEGLKTPTIGMYFETIEEAQKYYEDCGRQNSFWILTQTSSKGQNRSNEMNSMLFICAKGRYVAKTENDDVVEENDERDEDGKVIPKKRRTNCSTIKCGCNAHLRIKRDKWSLICKVIFFDNVHNYQLVTPFKRMKMKSNQHMPKAVKDLTEAIHRENLKVSKVSSIFGDECIDFDNRDCYNSLRNVRHRELNGGTISPHLLQKQPSTEFIVFLCDSM